MTLYVNNLVFNPFLEKPQYVVDLGISAKQ